MATRSALLKEFQTNVDVYARIKRATAASEASMHDTVIRSTKALSESRELLATIEKQIAQGAGPPGWPSFLLAVPMIFF
jgi:hypothetical protein